MTSKATQQSVRDRPPVAASWQASDTGPSTIRGEDPTVARLLGMVGAVLVVLGGTPLVLAGSGRALPIGPGWGTLFLTAGVILLLFHAALDWDVQFRRIYMGFGYLVFAVGVLCALLPYPSHVGDQFLKGFVLLVTALLFLLAFVRNETDPWLRDMALYFLGAGGAVMAAVGLFGGNLRGEFLMPYGVLLALLGLAYVTAFVMGRGLSDDLAYNCARVLGWVGLAVAVVAAGRAVLPASAGRWALSFAPDALLLVALGAAYGLTGLALASDNLLVVLTRRELGAQFCSPIAYILLFAYVLAHWLAYLIYLWKILDTDMPVPEPMVQGFILQWMAVLFTIVIAPVLTMRLLSEEKRTGTLEVLLTAPLDEGAVVVSKFLAAWLMFLFLWLPFYLLLVALRVEGGQPFDYRPLFSFTIGLLFTGAGFVAMGLFLSSLTRNQIISCILGIVGMLLLITPFFLQGILRGTTWVTVARHMSFIDVWFDTLEGKLVPVRLLFFATMAIFFLFLSVKVLEARKWA